MGNKKIARTNKEIVDMFVDVADCCSGENGCPFINKCNCNETSCREIWEKWLNGTINIEEKMATTSTINIYELVDEYIKDTNKTIKPFRLMKCESENYSLCLSLCDDYCQKPFNEYAKFIGEKEKNDYGLYTHGNGYEWKKVFCYIFKNDKDFEKIEFDCEAGGFYCYCNEIAILANFVITFKNICENENVFLDYIKAALKD